MSINTEGNTVSCSQRAEVQSNAQSEKLDVPRLFCLKWCREGMQSMGRPICGLECSSLHLLRCKTPLSWAQEASAVGPVKRLGWQALALGQGRAGIGLDWAQATWQLAPAPGQLGQQHPWPCGDSWLPLLGMLGALLAHGLAATYSAHAQ